MRFVDPTGHFSWESFGKGFGTAAVTIVVASAVVVAVAATGGAAAVVIAGALGASATTAAATGAVVSGTVYVAAAGYGGVQTGQKIYEAASGTEYELSGQGRVLTDAERSEAAGEAVAGTLAIGVMAAKARGARAQDQAMIDELVRVRQGRLSEGTETGDATFAQGRAPGRGTTPVAESEARAGGGGQHAEPQVNPPVGGTVAVDQTPCPNCAANAMVRGTRIIVPENPAKPGGSPKSAAQSAARGTGTAQPRTVIEGPQGPIPVPSTGSPNPQDDKPDKPESQNR